MAPRRIVNLAEAEPRPTGDGKAFVAQLARLADGIGSKALGCTLTVIPPGKAAFPFHRHHVIHELFYVLEGEGSARLGDETFPIRAGDLIAAPAGAEAHQIVNTSAAELRFLAFSTRGSVDVVEYPDTGKVAAAAGIRDADFSTATVKFLGRVTPADYFEGETTGEG